MKTKVTILGCGASAGVPLIGCECAVCTSDNPKNKRLRASILIERGENALLVDASPDLRQQALTAGFKMVDAVYVTHDHADHCHGIDDLRSFNYHRNDVLPIYADALTLDQLKKKFDYVFKEPSKYGWYRACLRPHTVQNLEPILVAKNIEILPFEQGHGPVKSYGIRIGNFAYSTDVKSFPEASFEALKGLDTWIVDCLSYTEKPTHAHLDLTLKWIEELGPRRAILTHMNHEFDYNAASYDLPENVEFAYDQMVFESS